jgi:hypothetical protein
VDPGVRAIIDRTGLIGSVDQISDNVDVHSSPPHYVKLRTLYEPAQQKDVPST